MRRWVSGAVPWLYAAIALACWLAFWILTR